MRRNEGHFRHALPQEGDGFFQVRNPGHDEESLPAAIFLSQQSLPDTDRVEGGDIGADGQAVDWRRRDDGEVPDTRQRQLERPRDRCRREGQHMHVRPQLLQTLFVLHPEMLLLIDHKQAEIREFDGLGQKRVGAHHDFDLAVSKLVPGRLGFLRRNETGQKPDLDRPASETVRERLVVLTRQQSRRRDNRHLLATHRDHKGRTQRDFSLAETDITADQAVHRPALGEVGEDIIDRVQLVIGFRIGKGGAEFVINPARRFNRVRLARQALGRNLDQLVRHIAQALLGLGLARLPGHAAQLVELRGLGLSAIA